VPFGKIYYYLNVGRWAGHEGHKDHQMHGKRTLLIDQYLHLSDQCIFTKCELLVYDIILF